MTRQAMDVTAAALEDIGRRVEERLAANPPEVDSLVFETPHVDADGPDTRELTEKEAADAVVVGGVRVPGERRGLTRGLSPEDRAAFHRGVAEIQAERTRLEGERERRQNLSPEDRETVARAEADLADPVRAAAFLAYQTAARTMRAAEAAHQAAMAQAKRDLMTSEAGRAYAEAASGANAALEAARRPFAAAFEAFNKAILGDLPAS